MRRLVSVLALSAAVLASVAFATPAGAAMPRHHHRTNAPYLGWSSWSMQATTRPGINPQGNYSWLTEQHVLQQADYMAAHLKRYGYRYVNIDAGWWRTWDWTPVYDDHGRPAVWPTRFPDGMASVVHHIHSLGLKVGIYLPAGMEIGKEGDNTQGQDLSETIEGAPQCTLADAIYPDHRTTNGWNSSYALDFDNGNGCAAAYVDSLVELFQSWGGVDLLKLDGAGPGSGHNDLSGANSRYDNRPEMAEYDRAFRATGHHVELQGSWALDIDYVSDWQKYLDSWRTSNDVECYCTTLTRWSSIAARLPNALQWAPYAGPHTGWSNLDSLEVGNGELDGLTQTERQTAMSIWSLAQAPLYLGDDLTSLDDYGLSLITNRAVLAIDQSRGATLTQVTQDGSAYVVARKLADRDVAIGLINLGDSATTIATSVRDVAAATHSCLRHRRAYALTDLWAHRTTQTTGPVSASVPAHGSVLLRLSDRPGAERFAPATRVDVSAADAALAPGSSTMITVTLTNNSAVALGRASLGLDVPSGWRSVRLSSSARRLPRSGSTAVATFRVTAPATASAPISTADLTGTATYHSGPGGTETARSPLTLSVVSPLDAAYRTANTTGAPARFGQLGSALAVSAAGANVGPTISTPFGTTAGGDDYGAIYLPSDLSADGTAAVTVTGQSGGTSAKAGLLARNDATANGTPVGVALYVSNGSVALVYNDTATGGTTYTARLPQFGGRPGGGTSVAYPVRLQLVRSGGGYTGSYSTDGGSTWTTVGTVSPAAQNAVQDVGVFQSSGSADSPALAEFADLAVQ